MIKHSKPTKKDIDEYILVLFQQHKNVSQAIEDVIKKFGFGENQYTDIIWGMVNNIYYDKFDEIYKWKRSHNGTYQLNFNGQLFVIGKKLSGAWADNFFGKECSTLRETKFEVNEELHETYGSIIEKTNEPVTEKRNRLSIVEK